MFRLIGDLIQIVILFAPLVVFFVSLRRFVIDNPQASAGERVRYFVTRILMLIVAYIVLIIVGSVVAVNLFGASFHM